MGLDILNPGILKAIDSIGGFCIVDESKIDYETYFPVDAAKIGVTLYDQVWNRGFNGPSPARFGTSGVTYNDKIYIFGGQTSPSQYNYIQYNDTWEYDPIAETWIQLGAGATKPDPRTGAGSALYGDYMYIWGGTSCPTGYCHESGPTYYQYYNDLWRYHIPSDTWEEITTTSNPIARYSHTLTVHDGYLYMMGGANGSSQATARQDCWRISLKPDTTNAWEGRAALPDYLKGHAAVSHHGYIYVYGGSIGDRYTLSPYPQFSSKSNSVGWFYRFDPINNNWTQLDDGPTSVIGASLNSYNDKLYLFGGSVLFQSDPTESQGASSRLYSYDTTNAVWFQQQNCPETRSGSPNIMINNKLWDVCGGGQTDNNTWNFTTDTGNPWHEKLPVPEYEPGYSPDVRSGSSYCMDEDNNIWMFGGDSADNPTQGVIPWNQLWKFNTLSQEWTQLSDNTNIVSWNGSKWITGSLGVSDTTGSRSGACMSYYNGKIYVFGGHPRNKNSTVTGAFHPCALLDIYDIDTDTWIQASEPMATYSSLYGAVDAECVIDKRGTGSFYVFGGDRSVDVQRLSQHLKYDIDTDTWTQLRGIDNTFNLLDNLGRAGHVYELNPVTNMIYVFGGMRTGQAGDAYLFRDMYIFDMDHTGTTPWTIIKNGSYPSDWPPARCYMEATIRDDGFIYMTGGWHWSGSTVTYYDDIYKFDPDTLEWVDWQNTPFSKGGFGMELNDKDDIWVIGQTPDTWMFRESDITSVLRAAVKIAKK